MPHVTNELLDALLVLSVDAGLELLLVGVRGITHALDCLIMHIKAESYSAMKCFLWLLCRVDVHDIIRGEVASLMVQGGLDDAISKPTQRLMEV